MNGSSYSASGVELLAAKRGDMQAFGEVLESHRRSLYVQAAAKLRGKLARRVSASDVVQEAMLTAHRSLADFRGTTRAEFAAWLRAILSHVVLNALDRHLKLKRDMRREIHLDATPGASSIDSLAHLQAREPSPSTVVRQSEDREQVRNLLVRLPSHYRQVILLRNYGGMRFDAVANVMNRTPSATRLLWLRAIRQLRKLQLQKGTDHERQ